jgi:putative membrane protein
MVDYDAKRGLWLLFRIRGSVVPELALRTLVVAAIGGGAAWLYQYNGFCVPPVAHTMLGLALGLLLVFRTNSSYDRFWEGRKLIGQMVNAARNLMRQSIGYIEIADEETFTHRRELQRHITLLYALVRQYLRGERDLASLGTLVTAAEKEALGPVAMRPLAVATWISDRLATCARSGRLTEQRLQEMDKNLTVLCDAWGGAERILRTPIPFAYAHHIKAFLVLFTFTVPFAVVESMKWVTPVASAVLAFALFGIEEIGVEIEEPFGYDANDLPLDAVGETIARDLGQLVTGATAETAPGLPRTR